MRTPEEIKRGLECCIAGDCDSCPYYEAKKDCGDRLKIDALAYIQQLEAAQPKWISVEERLPEIGVNVLTRTVGLLHPISTGWYSPTRKNWCLDNGSTLKVTHWMPLPEPPKEET